MSVDRLARPFSFLIISTCVAVGACALDADPVEELDGLTVDEDAQSFRLSYGQLLARANAIKAIHASHPIIDNPAIFAGIAYAETGMSHCYAEYGPAGCSSYYDSADCGGGSILAGGADLTCDEGGLGMFQFDEGLQWVTYDHWMNTGKWPPGAPVTHDVSDLEGNIAASIDFVLWKAWNSDYTPYFASYQDMYDWINSIRPINGNPDWETWLGFLAYNYNGQYLYTTAWYDTIEYYRNQTLEAYYHPAFGGDAYAFWYGGGGGPPPPPPPPSSCSPEGGLWCGGNGVTGDPNTLYVCDDGAVVVKEVCNNGCFAANAGSPDYCIAPNSANLDCSCANGKYHNGDDIPAGLTYCGFRVCGMDGNVWECTTADAWQQTGLSCGAGACSCPSGAHLDDTSIATQHTECHFQVCGGSNVWYTCEAGGWDQVPGSYCTMGSGAGGNDPNSCSGYCGAQAPGGCYCDAYCVSAGDCCADKIALCG